MFSFDPDYLKTTLDKIISSMKFVLEIFRRKDWPYIILLVDFGLYFILDPSLRLSDTSSIPKIFSHHLSKGTPPWWYPWFAWGVILLVFVAAFIVLARSEYEPVPSPLEPIERKALKGLRPFSFEDAEIFGRLQREEKLQECLQAITDQNFRFGILVGESGCGKTSFLQAGLWPRLLKNSHQCVYVKLTDLDPLNSIRLALAENFQLPHENLENADFLALLETVAHSKSVPLVLLFDQFEQFFTHHKRKEQREPFVQALAKWYKRKPPLPVKILVCMRGDFEHHLIELHKAMAYSLGPQEHFRLEKFTPKEATEIFRVIAETEDLSFDTNFVEDLAEQELASREDGFISPVDVQILAWMIKLQKTVGERSFTRPVYQKLGGLEGLLERFLSHALQARETEARRQTALKVLLAMTDLELNVRAGVLTIDDIEKKLTGTALPEEEIHEAIEWLSRGDVRLVTPVRRGATQGYELAHERLIPALRRLAGKELSVAEQANQLLDRRVHEWLGNNRDRRYLLRWRELRLIQRQKPYLVWGALQNQKEALLAQSQRYRHTWAASIGLIVLVPGLYFGWLWYTPWGQIWQVKNDVVRLAYRIRDTDVRNTAVIALLRVGRVEQAFQIAASTKTLDALAEAAINTSSKTRDNVVEQMRQMANAIDDRAMRPQAMNAITHAMARQAISTNDNVLLEKAIEMAKRIDDHEGRAYALSAIASELIEAANANKDKARAEQSLRVCREISEPWYRTVSLVSIIPTMASIALEFKDKAFAEQLLQTIQEGALTHDAPVLMSIAPAIRYIAVLAVELKDRVLLEQARLAAKRIDDSATAADTLSTIDLISDISFSIMEKDMSHVKQAFQNAAEIDDPERRSRDLDIIVGDLINFAARHQDKTLLEHASTMAKGIADPEGRANASGVIVEAMANLAVELKDKSLLTQAIAMADGIVDPASRKSALSAIVGPMGSLAAKIKDKALLEQTIKMANTIDDPEVTRDVLRTISPVAVDLAAKTKNNALFEQALLIATETKDAKVNAAALSAITLAVVNPATEDDSKVLVKLALDMAQWINDPARNIQVLLSPATTLAMQASDPAKVVAVIDTITKAAANLGAQTKNELLLKKAREMTKYIGYFYSKRRDEILSVIISAKADFSANEEKLMEALEDANKIDDTAMKAKALSAIAAAFARFENWRQARNIVEQNDNDNGKALALAAILQVWAKHQNSAMKE